MLRHRGRGSNYARRQQYRRLCRAGRLGLAGLTAGLFGMLLIAIDFALPGCLLLAVAVIVGRALGTGCPSPGGAGSALALRTWCGRALPPLEEHGWRVRHGMRWPGGGDIDSVAIAPNGVGFAIETKTRTYDQRHLGRVAEQARWLPRRRRRRWCHAGALPALCVVRAIGVEHHEHDVLVVSIDRLVPVIWDIANGTYQLMQLRGRSVA
jgi:Nuclease-related domain